MRPDISIIILTKNGAKDLETGLPSIYQQETEYTFEVIVIDSGSTDGSLEIIRKYPVRLYEIPPKEFSHSGTRNKGASLAQGKYLVYITQDAIPANKEWLAKLVAPVITDPMVAGACSRVLPREHCNPVLAREVEADLLGRPEKIISFIEDPVKYEQMTPTEKRIFTSYHDISSCMKKEVWEGYPYPSVSFAEDVAWAKLVLEKGYKIVHEPESVVLHSHDYDFKTIYARTFVDAKANKLIYGRINVASFLDVLKLTIYLFGKNKEYLEKRHFRGLMKWRLLAFGLAYHFVEMMGQYRGSYFEKFETK